MSHALLKDTNSFDLQEVEKYFNRYNIDLTSTNFNERGFLHEAVYNTDPNVLKYFIKKGAPINHQANDGFTALHHAVQLNSLAAVSTLLEHKASIDIKTNTGRSPLDIDPVHPEIKSLLISYKSNNTTMDINSEEMIEPLGVTLKPDHYHHG